MEISIIVLSYNHEDYICDCLESIKYQVMKYGSKEHKIEVIVTDDCSSDNTVEVVEKWKEKNETIFDNFIIIRNKENIGTCNNYENALAASSGKYIKLIGGDDLFPYNSMYKIFDYLRDYDIVTGLPFEYIIDSDNNPVDIQTLTHKYQCLNKQLEKKSFYELIERRCFLNAPATYIRREIAANSDVVNFVRSYVFTEDYPQWVKASEIKNIRYRILDEYTIIYRRTNKSASIVKATDSRFLNDRIRIYQYLYKRTHSIASKMIIQCSLSAFKRGKLLPNKYLNILSYANRFYWYKNKKKTTPQSIAEIENNLNYINALTHRNI